MPTLIIQAIQFASKYHDGQKRKSTNLPYVTHPIIVAELVRKFKASKHIEELVCASILHDCVEDTKATNDMIRNIFGSLVADLVKELTNDDDLIATLGKNKMLISKMLKMSNYALVLKLADRLSNILDNPTKEYLEDTRVMMNKICRLRKLTDSQKAIFNEINIILFKELNEDKLVELHIPHTTYFGLKVYKYGVKASDIRKLPFSDYWAKKSFGSTCTMIDKETYIYLHDWEKFCKQFLETGE